MAPIFDRMLRALILLLCLPASAMAESLAFDVTLAGVKVAVMEVEGVAAGGAYRATAQISTRGVAGAVRPVQWTTSVQGQINGGRFLPKTWREEVVSARRQSRAHIVWTSRVPEVMAYESGEEVEVLAVDPAGLRGTVDPLTALFAGMRPVDPARACRLAFEVYDGQRRTSVALSSPQPDGEGVRCAGSHRRIAGFPAKEMAKRTQFSFAVTYMPRKDGLLHIDRIETETLYGRAVLQRR